MVDADVLFAAAASSSEQGASLLVLRLAELTLLDAVASTQVIVEAERNLTQKLTASLPTFRLLVARCLRVTPDPAVDARSLYRGCAEPEDLPILVAAVQANCQWLVTFNVRHFQPGVSAIQVVRPSDLILRVRHLLNSLT
ncbi:MAG: PIN domain-containing protein [Caldilineaceae bacterium]|jgi:predicted nucleic acid-binding protein|nr:PIN domain-containing protein [Caldilineaceae bacterium]